MNQVQVMFTGKVVDGVRDWGKFKLTAVYVDELGDRRCDVYGAGDLPGEYEEVFGRVVEVVCGIGGDWCAEQVWARLCGEVVGDGDEVEYVVISIEAVRDSVFGCGGRRVFTHEDYPQFVFRDEDVVGMFKDFTGGKIVTKDDERR